MDRRWLIAIPVIIYAGSVNSLMRGDFAGSDLPEKVIGLHAIGNGMEALGWLLIFLLYGTRHAAIAGRIGLFLIGMWFWDMVTTLPINVPVAPYQTIWGPASLLLLLYIIQPLLRDSSSAQKKSGGA